MLSVCAPHKLDVRRESFRARRLEQTSVDVEMKGAELVKDCWAGMVGRKERQNARC